MRKQSSRRQGSTGVVWFASLALAVLVTCQPASAQVAFQTGQNVSPAFEGWEENDDGSFNLVFGYMNRNWREQLDVPIGPGNNISPGSADQGQPTHFLPRRHTGVFAFELPAGTSEPVVWTLNVAGNVARIPITFKPEYLITPFLKSLKSCFVFFMGFSLCLGFWFRGYFDHGLWF